MIIVALILWMVLMGASFYIAFKSIPADKARKKAYKSLFCIWIIGLMLLLVVWLLLGATP